MPYWCRGIGALGLIASVATIPVQAGPAEIVPLDERTRQLLATLDGDRLIATDDVTQTLPALELQIRGCAGYPYHEGSDVQTAARTLLADLREGMQTGLQCLGGRGPAGRLHPFHEYQAHRLLSLFEDARPKTLQCVEDAMFATAVATSPHGVTADDPLYTQLRRVSHPAVVLDTYRLGGILSRQYDDQTYRAFFHLGEAQILEHRNGQPLRPASLHRYRDRAGLLFHETVHWLGHEHSALYPDLTHLYETCCFGGSDYISDPLINRGHQQTACAILKDDELWSNSYNRYKQMRLWHLKGYDAFKAAMRADYAG